MFKAGGCSTLFYLVAAFLFGLFCLSGGCGNPFK